MSMRGIASAELGNAAAGDGLDGPTDPTDKTR